MLNTCLSEISGISDIRSIPRVIEKTQLAILNSSQAKLFLHMEEHESCKKANNTELNILDFTHLEFH